MIREIYFAGGCFWGVEHLFSSVYGVIQAVSGYANGISEEYASYEKVLAGNTGFRECVRIKYDSETISLENLLFIFFCFIDKSVANRQGGDIGNQYQSGIYYTDDYSERIVEHIGKIEKSHGDLFMVEIKPLKNFFLAEEYHQQYLEKNPGGYCHIDSTKLETLPTQKISRDEYIKPALKIYNEKIQRTL